ncbi:MAG TPA: L-fucose:H+ symporter permease [Candidatus Binatus sp.]|jgi:FHS family L-fucose permease-like MFS transporter|nr:L-fucose:H+ symporter permease [Candidatus Binatus sp.]
MAIAAPNTSTTSSAPDTGQSYGAPLATVTTLFFMWGFLTCLNDILVPHLKSIFDLNYRQSQLIQLAFFGAYFVFSFPASKIVDWIGYQRSMVVGLLTAGVGAFLFVPAASAPSYPLFLGALIVLAAGITCLQVAANPYVTVLGKPETASSRLNLTQAFNSLGTFLAPFFGGLLILSAAPKAMDEIRAMAPDVLQAYRQHEAATVKTPYIGLGITLVLLAIAIGSFKLPTIAHAQHKVGEKVNDSIWKHPSLIFGAIAIFVYVGAEVSIGSFLVNYFSQPDIGGLTEKAAANLVAFYWGGAMVGRFIGSALLQKMKTGQLLSICAVCAGALVAISMLATGHVAMYSIILVGLFNSIMFPSIFTLGVAELGPLTGDGSGVMIMAIVGGALIPYAQGAIADRIGIHHAFFLPVICYLYILFFALSGSKPNSQRYAKA